VRPWLPIAAVLVAVVILGVHSASLQPWTLDDAYITFRYAEHLADGHGPVYNVGERVEGYTTFLWVALLALGSAAGLTVEPLSKILGVALGVSSLGLLATTSRVAGGDDGWDERGAAVAVLTLGSCGMFTGWVMSGMEVALVVALSTATWLAHLARRPVATGVLGALATMTRPDALLVPLVQATEHALRRDWRALGRHLGPFVALYGPYFGWRFTYYGWLLPNTFYAKVGTTSEQLARGLEYVVGFLGPGALLVLPLVGVVVWWRRASLLWTPLAWAALHVAYVVAVGGDVMPAWRFFAPVLPVLAWTTGWVLQRAAERWPPAPWAVTVVVAFQLWQLSTHRELRGRILGGNVGRNGVEVGRWLRDQVPPDTLLATNTAGSVPYFSQLPTIDMLGLNDAHIAHRQMPHMGSGKAGHEKADGAYVLSRQPDLVLFGAARGRKTPAFRSDRELYAQPEFRTQYQLESYRLPSGATVHLWRRAGSPPLADEPLRRSR
jgi:hypothetical protein